MASLGGPNIVTSGLVLSLDAANVKSYPGSGTTWRDLSGNGYNFAGTGSFSFSNNAIIFNRSNVTNTGTVFTLSNIANQLKIENFLASSFTIEVWCLPQTLSGSNVDATETLQSLITWPGFHNAMRFNQGSTTFASVWNSARTSEFAIDSTGSLLSISSFNQVIGIVDRGATTSLG
jgi:hypothetical protein